MEKWADYLVVAARYDKTRTRIAALLARPDEGPTLGRAVEMSREAVIAALSRHTFITAVLVEGGRYKKGAPIEAVRVDREVFLRTDADDSAADNLGRLPEF